MVSGRQGVVVPQSQFSNLTSTLDFHCMVLSCAFRSCSLRKSLNTSFSPKLRGFWEHLLQYGSLVGLFSIWASVQLSRAVMSDSLRPHESQHARPPCPSPTTGVHSDSCPSSQWCHPAISYSVIPFSSCPQSLSASESFPMSKLFAWGGQSTGFQL